MKKGIIFIAVIGLVSVAWILYRRFTASGPSTTYLGRPLTLASADDITLQTMLSVLPSNAQQAWQAGDTISLSGSITGGDFSVGNKMLGNTTQTYIPATPANYP